MFFAYTGSFIVLAFWEPLCNAIAGVSGKLTYDPQAWQTAMIIVSTTCLVLFVLTFKMTRERIKPAIKQTNIAEDLKSLLHNGPWWILLGGVLFLPSLNVIGVAMATPTMFAISPMVKKIPA